jgi:hypothetical protein
MKSSIKSCLIKPLFHDLLATYLFPLCLIWCYLQGPKKSWHKNNNNIWFTKYMQMVFNYGLPNLNLWVQTDNTSHTCMLFDYFYVYFLGNIPKIFLIFFWKILLKKDVIRKKKTIWLRFMLIFWQKMSLKKKPKSIYKFFYYLKVNITMFNECFCYFFTHWINFKLIHMFPWYIKNTTI